MKQLSLFLLTICWSVLLHAQSLHKDVQAVQQTIIQLFDALSNKDSVALKARCTDDVKFYEYGATWTIDSMIDKTVVKNTAPDFQRTNKIAFVNTTINGNTAWATYDLYSEVTSDDKHVSIHWMETQVLIKQDKRWKVKLLHSTIIKRS